MLRTIAKLAAAGTAGAAAAYYTTQKRASSPEGPVRPAPGASEMSPARNTLPSADASPQQLRLPEPPIRDIRIPQCPAQSGPCGTIPREVCQLLNEQIGHEISAAERYSSMASFLKKEGAPPALVKKLESDAEEEIKHANAFKAIIEKQGGEPQVRFPANNDSGLNLPRNVRGTGETVELVMKSLDEAIRMERHVAGKIEAICEATENGLTSTTNPMQRLGLRQVDEDLKPFVLEQVTAEKDLQLARAEVAKLAGDPDLPDLFEACERIFKSDEDNHS
tara:strand:+ start:350 stop:1183 length:834 start_codon:yes stop_codon:yes gene_type:complete